MGRYQIAVGVSLILLVCPAVAQGAFPGANGKLALARSVDGNTDVYVMETDGSNVTRLTTEPASDWDPAWSADGTKIVFTSNRDGNNEVYVMNADGSGQTNLSQNPSNDFSPTWSPDSTRIAFASYRDNTCSNPPDNCPVHNNVYIANADGSNQVKVPNAFSELSELAWSPDGQRITSTYCNWYEFEDPITEITYWERCPYGLEWGTIRLDGTGGPNGRTGYSTNWAPGGRHVVWKFDDTWIGASEDIAITNMQSCCSETTFATDQQESSPIWSPDGQKILFYATGYPGGAGVFTMNPDGTGVTRLPGVPGPVSDWQPLPTPNPPGYARPQAATPESIPLVLAYKACMNANGSHGAPLALSSCSPPRQESGYATIGHGDGHPTAAKSVGRVVLKVVGETPIIPSNGNQADVLINASITDVRNLDFSDYAGELRFSSTIRITDRYNGGQFTPQNQPATLTDLPFESTLTCIPTSDQTIGSFCRVITTANAFQGFISEGRRTIWELGQVKVYDGGADGDADTAGDNTLFAVQGLFAP